MQHHHVVKAKFGDVDPRAGVADLVFLTGQHRTCTLDSASPDEQLEPANGHHVGANNYPMISSTAPA